MFRYRGKTALITGASSGIGAEFARELARRGMSLVVTARSTDVLNALARELEERYAVAVSVITADLARPDDVDKIARFVRERNLEVDLLINNAGLLSHGRFETIDPQRERDEIAVNVSALTALTHEFLPGMLQRGFGGVINVASIAGYQPIPFLAVYGATKAFVISFSIALWEECRDRGVTVLCLCPGNTTTNLFDAAQAPEAALGKPRTVTQVVATALKGLDKRRSLITDGTKNTLLSLGPRLIPRWFAAKCAGATVRPRKGSA